MTGKEHSISLERVIHGLVDVREVLWDRSPVLVVDARDLHEFLGVKTEFRDWIKRRLEEYEFQEDQDFRFSLKNERNSKGRPSKECELSLDTAKEIAMVEKTDQGRMVRRYFIECERKLSDLRRSARERATRFLDDPIERFLAGYEEPVPPLTKLKRAAEDGQRLAELLGVSSERSPELVRGLLQKFHPEEFEAGDLEAFASKHKNDPTQGDRT